MARAAAVGQLRGGIQSRADARAPWIEHIHSDCRGADCVDYLNDGWVCYWSLADPRLAHTPTSICFRPDAAVPGDHHPYLLPGAGDAYLQHAACDRVAADRPVHAFCCLLDARSLRQYAD